MLKPILTILVLPMALLFGPPHLYLNRLNGIKDLKNLLCFRGERVRKIIFSKRLA
jgi:hypothetical protein